MHKKRKYIEDCGQLFLMPPAQIKITDAGKERTVTMMFVNSNKCVVRVPVEVKSEMIVEKINEFLDSDLCVISVLDFQSNFK